MFVRSRCMFVLTWNLGEEQRRTKHMERIFRNIEIKEMVEELYGDKNKIQQVLWCSVYVLMAFCAFTVLK